MRPTIAYKTALAEATRHHANSKTYSGRFLRPHKPFLTELIGRLGVRSILDYGCGKGEQYRWVDPADGLTLEQAWNCEVAKYDPAYPPFAAEPQGQFDLVICTYVLGGIPITDHPWVLERLHGYATKVVFIAERLGPIKKKVHGRRDGFLNASHATEWLDLIAPRTRDGVETHLAIRYASKIGKFTGRFQL